MNGAFSVQIGHFLSNRTVLPSFSLFSRSVNPLWTTRSTLSSSIWHLLQDQVETDSSTFIVDQLTYTPRPSSFLLHTLLRGLQRRMAPNNPGSPKSASPLQVLVGRVNKLKPSWTIRSQQICRELLNLSADNRILDIVDGLLHKVDGVIRVYITHLNWASTSLILHLGSDKRERLHLTTGRAAFSAHMGEWAFEVPNNLVSSSNISSNYWI